MGIFKEVYMPNKLEDYNICYTYHKGIESFNDYVEGCWIMLRLVIDGLGSNYRGQYLQKTAITAITPPSTIIFVMIAKKLSRIPITFPLYQDIPSFAFLS